MHSESGLTFKALDGILLVRFTGVYPGYERSLSVLRNIAEKLQDASGSEILIDATAVKGRILSVDRFRLVLSFARMLPPHMSIAVLEARERHIPDYLLETIFRKYDIRGAEFVERDAAFSWLNRERTSA